MALEDASDSDACTGWSIGPCDILCSLSHGPAKTLLAQHDNESLVVLRRLDADPAAIPDLQTHAERISRINHPNLARALPLQFADEGAFWQSEYSAGASLEEIRASCKKAGKSLPLGLIFATLHEAALAIAELHSRHLAHGEVRDTNLLVTFGGTTKVLAPGVADCVQRLPPDPPCDVLALANLLYECLTGQVATGPAFAHPSSFNHALEKPVDDLLLRALGPDRIRRFKTAAELAQALKAAAGVYMWKPQQRADFVAGLFKTRKHREATLLASARARLLAMKREKQFQVEAAAAAQRAVAVTEIAEVAELPIVMGSLSEDGPGIPPRLPTSKKVQRSRGRALATAIAALAACVVLVQIWPSEKFVPPPIVLPTPPQAEAMAAPVPAPDVVEEAPPAPAPVESDAADSDKPKARKHKKHGGSDAPLPPWLMRKGRR